jgi:hypothetical protein
MRDQNIRIYIYIYILCVCVCVCVCIRVMKDKETLRVAKSEITGTLRMQQDTCVFVSLRICRAFATRMEQ